MRRVLTAALLGLAIGASSGVPAIAQDTPTGLTTALASVPDTLEVHQQLVSWTDYDALIGSRVGAAHPASIAALLASLDADDPAARLWMAALNGAASGWGRLQRYLFTGGAKWPQTVGFDFTDVRSELAFGAPPEDGIVLRGTFDPVRTAPRSPHATSRRRTPTRSASGAVPMAGTRASSWTSSRRSFRSVRGELGRRNHWRSLRTRSSLRRPSGPWMDARRDDDAGPSLAVDGDDSALAGALAGEGTFIQATLVPGTALLLIPPRPLALAPLRPRSGTAGTAAAHFDAIPSAWLLGIGDAATASEQVVTLALAYSDPRGGAGSDRCAPGRLDTMTSVARSVPGRRSSPMAVSPRSMRTPSNARMVRVRWRCSRSGHPSRGRSSTRRPAC